MENTQIYKPESEILQLTNINNALVVAEDCAKLIREKHLSAKIQGKEFVMVEGWQFAGTRFGIIPIAGNPKRLERDDEIIYECTCDLINVATGQVVGHGYALCSSKEQSKRGFAEYALASMAQTRSIGKAYRNLLSWLMKSSGFEPTPFEEMDEVKNIYKQENIPDPKQTENLSKKYEELFKGKSPDEIKQLYNNLSANEKGKDSIAVKEATFWAEEYKKSNPEPKQELNQEAKTLFDPAQFEHPSYWVEQINGIKSKKV